MALIKTKTGTWQEHFSVSALLNPRGNVEKTSKMHGPLTFRIKSSLQPSTPVARQIELQLPLLCLFNFIAQPEALHYKGH